MLSLFLACEDAYTPVSSGEESDDSSSTAADNSENYENSGANALAANSTNHDDLVDYVWDAADVVQITLNDNATAISGAGATIKGNIVTIASSGNYKFSGSLTNGQIRVNTEDESIVRIILSGVSLKNSTTSPVYVEAAEKVMIVLADNTVNTISDGSSYNFDGDSDEPNAAIFSKADLTIYGNGTLAVDGNYNDGIASKDGVIISSGTLTVDAKDDGIRGKDYIIIKDGSVTVICGGDGLKSDNEEDETKGYISIEDGFLRITSTGDAMEAQTDAIVRDGQLVLISGGGSSSRLTSTSASAKAIKGIVNTIIDGGTITINSADDAIHSNGNLVINDGDIKIFSNDDGVHADSNLEINGGDIEISKCYEGVESENITINGGTIHVVASDDGLNGAGGNDGSGMGGWPRGLSSGGSYYLYINGGYIVLNTTGDGIDVNGSIEMTGGVVLISGPTASNNGALDYDSSFRISGGFLAAAGSSGMAQAPGTASSQCSVLLTFRSALQAGMLFHIEDNNGKNILSFVPEKMYQSMAFSSSYLISGTSYKVYYGGSSTGTETDGLYENGAYTPGTEYTSFSISSVVTRVSVR